MLISVAFEDESFAEDAFSFFDDVDDRLEVATECFVDGILLPDVRFDTLSTTLPAKASLSCCSPLLVLGGLRVRGLADRVRVFGGLGGALASCVEGDSASS